MLLGSLKEQLCYPLPQDTRLLRFWFEAAASLLWLTRHADSACSCEDSFSEDTLRDTLKRVRLQKLLGVYIYIYIYILGGAPEH